MNRGLQITLLLNLFLNSNSICWVLWKWYKATVLAQCVTCWLSKIASGPLNLSQSALNFEFFENLCLRKSLRISWPRIISNQDLLETNRTPYNVTIKRYDYTTLLKNTNEVCRAALY